MRGMPRSDNIVLLGSIIGLSDLYVLISMNRGRGQEERAPSGVSATR